MNRPQKTKTTWEQHGASVHHQTRVTNVEGKFRRILLNESECPTKSSLCIPINGNQKTESEEGLDDEAIAHAEYCDFCMFARIFHGITKTKRQGQNQDPEIVRQNNQTLENVVRTRMSTVHHLLSQSKSHVVRPQPTNRNIDLLINDSTPVATNDNKDQSDRLLHRQSCKAQQLWGAQENEFNERSEDGAIFPLDL
jgi:hypothetical protein